MIRPMKRTVRRAIHVLCEQLEQRCCLTSYTIPGFGVQSISLTGVQVGDLVTIKPTLTSTDPDDTAEGEPLIITTASGQRITIPLFQPGPINQPGGPVLPTQTVTFVATVPDEIITAGFLGADNDETGILDITFAQIQITIPNNQTQFYITADPAMPTITANVSLTGTTQDIANTTFNWQILVDFDHTKDAPYAKNDTIYSYTTTTQGATATFDNTVWNDIIRGGDVTLTAKATIDGVPVTAKLSGLNIGANRASNPTQAAINSYIDTNYPTPANWPSGTSYSYDTILHKTVSFESSFRQFKGNFPYFNQNGKDANGVKGNGDGGVGVMQITHPAPTDEQVWDWKANIDEGVAIFNAHLAGAITYLNSQYNKAVAAIPAIQKKYKVATVNIDPITPDMIMREAATEFNGGHEYVLKNKKYKTYSVQVVDGVATVSWRDARPKYANKLIAQPTN